MKLHYLACGATAYALPQYLNLQTVEYDQLAKYDYEPDFWDNADI